ncbi:hypothetical protein [Cellulomonas sp. URHB0016]
MEHQTPAARTSRTPRPDAHEAHDAAPDPRARAAGPAEPVETSALTALQRSAGNRAVQRLVAGTASPIVVQRDPVRERLAAYVSAVREERWNDAATSLRGFNDQSMRQRVNTLGTEQRVKLVRASLRGRPAWSARITAAVTAAGDAEAVRRGRLLADWDDALAAGTWGPATTALAGLPDPDVRACVTPLTAAQRLTLVRTSLHGAPAWGPRIVGVIATVDPEADRVGRLYADWETQVAAPAWGPAAVVLNGFNDRDMRDLATTLTHDQRVLLVRAALPGRRGWAARVVAAVRAGDTEAARVGTLYADWDEAVAAGTWGPAATTLNGFNDTDIAALVQLLPVGQLRDLKAGARAALGAGANRVVDPVDARIGGAVIAAGDALTGNLRWRGGQGPGPGPGYQLRDTTAWGHQDDFARWINGIGPEPGPASTMNCWEAVLFFGFRSGVIPKTFLVSMHQDASAAAGAAATPVQARAAWYSTLQARMHTGPLLTYTINSGTGVGAPDIPAGNIVFIDNLNHVVLSRGSRDGSGRMRVLSLWVFPAALPPGPILPATSYGVVQDTSVEEVVRNPASVITYGKPPW